MPDGVYDHFQAGIGARGKTLREAWFAKLAEYAKEYPDLADELEQMQKRQLPDGWDKDIPTFPADAKGMASRDSSGKVLNAIAKNVPWLIGGSADLAPSTKTTLDFEGAGDFEARQLRRPQLPLRHPRARDGARSLNGMALTQGPAVRLGLLDLHRLRAPVDPLSADHGDAGDLRLHARLDRRRRRRADPPADRASRRRCARSRACCMIRPADANEVAEAWRVIMQLSHEPAALICSPPGAADARPHQVRPRLRPRQGRATCWPTPPTASPT